MSRPKVKTRRRTTKTEEVTLEFGAGALLEALRATHPEIPDEGVTLKVRVPGGGDWSNTDLLINEGDPLIVEWTTRKETET